ncbi:HD family phosphohydrolase [Bacillota bacterium Meth-B3]
MNFLKKLNPALTAILIAAASFVLLFIMLAATITPKRYDIRAGEVSSITITASKDVEDALSTRRLVEAAARAVQNSYVSDAQVQPAVQAALQDGFARLLSYRSRTEAMPEGEPTSEAQRLEARGALGVKDAAAAAIDALVHIEPSTLSALYQRTFALVRETLSAQLAEGQEEESIQKIRRDLMIEDFDDGAVAIAEALVRSTIAPNMLLDEHTTELNRQKAIAEVEPVVYKKGQNIVRAGEVVTESQIQMLDDLGMLKDKKVDLTLYLGLGTLLALLFATVLFHLYGFTRERRRRDMRAASLLALIAVATVALCMLVRPISPYLMPVSLGAMLTTLLVSPSLAIVVNLALSVLSGLLAQAEGSAFTSAMSTLMLTSIVSGSLCVPLIKRRPQRLTILLAGMLVASSNMLTTLALGLIGSASQSAALNNALWAGVSGVLSAALCLLLQLAFEYLFNLVTPSKLMELSSPNQPLLRRLLLEAPGTYHHSILVANLAEAAANAVGADGLLARVGAYYHDVGKLKRPLYFKENQLLDNPHDRTDPRVSTAILTAHPRDGVEMGARARLPQAVLDIIAQHHGDTPVLFFYDKAVKQGGEVDLDGFRYDCPRPTSREAGIVMLADTVEAAARAVPDPTPEKIGALIRRLARSKMEDGQLDECPLTFADISKVVSAFVTVLIGVYHERVEYPDITLPDRKQESMPQPEHAVQVAGEVAQVQHAD